jgi:hypothetical protein
VPEVVTALRDAGQEIDPLSPWGQALFLFGAYSDLPYGIPRCRILARDGPLWTVGGPREVKTLALTVGHEEKPVPKLGNSVVGGVEYGPRWFVGNPSLLVDPFQLGNEAEVEASRSCEKTDHFPRHNGFV